jgi:Tol biopolymer transport system component
MHPTLPFVVTDAYPREPVTRGDGTAPLRLIDLRNKTEVALAQVLLTTKDTAKLTSEHRIDAHPVWDATGRFIVFNGVHNDTRSVFVADVGEWLQKAMSRT